MHGVVFVRRDAGAHDIRFSDELGDEAGCWFVVNLRRVSDLLDAALIDHRDSVAHRQSLFLVVRYEHERNAQTLLKLLEFPLHLSTELCVQRLTVVRPAGGPLVRRRWRGRARRVDVGRRTSGRGDDQQIVPSETISTTRSTRRFTSAEATPFIRSPNAMFS